MSKEKYLDDEKLDEIRNQLQQTRRKYLRYRDAEIVYSIQHKKLLELAGKAGAIIRFDGYVLIDRDRFDAYLEQFREPSTLIVNVGGKS